MPRLPEEDGHHDCGDDGNRAGSGPGAPFLAGIGRRLKDGRGLAGVCVPFQALQVGTHLRRALIAEVAVFLQGFVDDPFQFGGHVGIQPKRGRGCCVENSLEDDRGTLAAERRNARGHLVEHGAEREQVAAAVDFFRARLLGRHVSRSTEVEPWLVRCRSSIVAVRPCVDALWLEELVVGESFATPSRESWRDPAW